MLNQTTHRNIQPGGSTGLIASGAFQSRDRTRDAVKAAQPVSMVLDFVNCSASKSLPTPSQNHCAQSVDAVLSPVLATATPTEWVDFLSSSSLKAPSCGTISSDDVLLFDDDSYNSISFDSWRFDMSAMPTRTSFSQNANFPTRTSFSFSDFDSTEMSDTGIAGTAWQPPSGSWEREGLPLSHAVVVPVDSSADGSGRRAIEDASRNGESGKKLDDSESGKKLGDGENQDRVPGNDGKCSFQKPSMPGPDNFNVNNINKNIGKEND
eukprot:Selendium_serpulae@DN3710_c0_g1_i1.p1